MKEILTKAGNDELSLYELGEITKACLASIHRRLQEQEGFGLYQHCHVEEFYDAADWIEMLFIDYVTKRVYSI